MSNKYLFLDIDGVLNSPNWAERNLADFQTGKMSMRRDFDRDAVARLDRILKATGAKVVVSSTWRRFTPLEEIRGLCVKHGLSSEHEFIDCTPCLSTYRGDEIRKWMDEEGVQPHQIVILDDDSDMTTLMDRLVQTARFDGLMDEHVEKAIAMLGGCIECAGMGATASGHYPDCPLR